MDSYTTMDVLASESKWQCRDYVQMCQTHIDLTWLRYRIAISFCCAQFYVTKERIHRYTYEQWLSLYHARLEPFYKTQRENEQLGHETQWFGGPFEHMWQVILGLHPTNALEPAANTTTDRCQWFRPSCEGSPCTDSPWWFFSLFDQFLNLTSISEVLVISLFSYWRTCSAIRCSSILWIRTYKTENIVKYSYSWYAIGSRCDSSWTQKNEISYFGILTSNSNKKYIN